MLNKILMPSGGQTTDELVILQWNKKVGDRVKRGDILFEIETDKAILTVESYAEGTLLQIGYGDGARVRVGEVVAYIGAPGDELPSNVNKPALSPEQRPTIADQAPTTDLNGRRDTPPSPKQAGVANGRHESKPHDIVPDHDGMQRQKGMLVKEDDKIYASPLAKSQAKAENVKLEDVARYVSKNLLKKNDITAYLQHISDTKTLVDSKGSTQDDFYMVEATAMRRTIARRMKESVSVSPHYTISVDVDMTETISLRQKLNNSLNAKQIKISYNDLIMKVVAKAIASHPYVNSSFTEDGIKVYRNVHFGLAIAVEAGLVVPVIRDVNRRSLLEIAEANMQSIAKVKSGRVHESDITGGTITLSNLGMFGMKEFTAIINQPESCILAVGAIIDKPVSVNREVKIRDIMNITASFDHRVVDGAIGAAFLQEVKHILENPHLLVL